jgi:putative transposase
MNKFPESASKECMARPPRIDLPGLVSHVTNRGVKKLALFHDREDRQRFLQLLLLLQTQYPFILQGYSLMTNHFHLLIKTIDASLSRLMQIFSSRYAFWFNRKYGQVGHAFQSRFHSIPVQTDAYLAEVSAYIDLNAPRAGIVARPEDYEWCGYRATVSGEPDGIIDSSELLALFSDDRERARILYQNFTLERLRKEEPLTHEKLLRKRSWGQLPEVTAGRSSILIARI